MWLSTSSTRVHTSGKCNEQYIDLRLHTELSPNIKHKSTTQELGVNLTMCKARDLKKTYMEIINEEESMNNDHLVSNNNLWVSRLKGAPRFPSWNLLQVELSLCFQVETVPWFSPPANHWTSTLSPHHHWCWLDATKQAPVQLSTRHIALSALKLHDFRKSNKSNMLNTLEIITNHNTTQCPSEGPFRILSCGGF